MAGWSWSDAVYEAGTIICKVPALDSSQGNELEGASLLYNVDVALNGQQFTNKPL